MSYRVYVPTTYDPKVPNKMILLAHGFFREPRLLVPGYP